MKQPNVMLLLLSEICGLGTGWEDAPPVDRHYSLDLCVPSLLFIAFEIKLYFLVIWLLLRHYWFDMLLYYLFAFIFYRLLKVVYNLYFHPLSQFPGPKLAAATHAFEFYWSIVRDGEFIWEIERMHNKYGTQKPTKEILGLLSIFHCSSDQLSILKVQLFA